MLKEGTAFFVREILRPIRRLLFVLITWALLAAPGTTALFGQTDPLDIPFPKPLYLLHISWTHTYSRGKVENDFYMLHEKMPDEKGMILRPAEGGTWYQSKAEYHSGPHATPRRVCEATAGLRAQKKVVDLGPWIRCPAATPPPEPKRKPAESATPSVNQPPQVQISVDDEDKTLVPDQKVVFTATASDDKDTPEQLKYSWRVENLDTGKTAEKATGQRNWVTWTPHNPGRYRITVTVTDRDGAEGQDSIEVTVEKPSIEKIEFKGAARNRTSDYLSNGILAARRGQYFGIDITLKHVLGKIHRAELHINGERLKRGEPNPDKWVSLKTKLWKTEQGETKFRYYVFTPSAIPIGTYKVEAVLVNRDTKEEIDRKALEPDLMVLFNPFPPFKLDDISVREGNPLSDEETNSYTLDPQSIVYFPDQGGAPSSPFDVSPYDPKTLKVALNFLEEMPETNRAFAEKVAEHLTIKASGMIWGKWQEPYCLKGAHRENISPEECEERAGEWVGGTCYLEGENDPSIKNEKKCTEKGYKWIANPYWAGTPPWAWNSVSEICEKYLDTKKPVKYVQCFVYAHIMTALQRSLGIPARTVTTWDSGHDKYPPWGIQSVFYDNKKRTIDFEVWNFHCWNEAWLPPVNAKSGWAIVDATPQRRASDRNADMLVAVPGLNEIPVVPRLPLGKQYPDGRDDVFVYTECNLPATNYIKVDCDVPWPYDFWDRSKFNFLIDTPPANLYSATHIYFNSPAGTEDGIGNYRPAAPPSSPSFTASSILFPSLGSFLKHLVGPEPQIAKTAKKPSIKLSGPKEISLRNPFRGEIEVTDLASDTPVNLTILVNYFPLDFNGGAEGPGAARPELKYSQEIEITPQRGAWSGAIDIPGDIFSMSGQYRWTVTVGSVSEGTGSETNILVRGIPLTLTLPDRLTENESFTLKAVLSNTLDSAVSQAELRLKLPSSWKTSDPLSVGPQELAPGAELILETKVKAEKAGKFLIAAQARGSSGPSFASTEVIVVGKPELTIDALPVEKAPVGKAFEASVEIINDGVETAKDIEVRLTPVEGVKIMNEPTQRLGVLKGKSQVKVVWKIQAERKGIFRLPIEASTTDGIRAEEILVIYAGSDDPEEMEALEDAAEAGKTGQKYEAKATAADELSGLDERPVPAAISSIREPEAPSEAKREVPPSGTPGAGGDGRPAVGGPVVGPSLSTPWPLVGLLGLLLANTALITAFAVLRRRKAETPQKINARIDVFYRDGGRKTFEVRKSKTSIGRAEDNSLVIHDPDVSSRHAEISVVERTFLLKDLASTNGTFLNGKRISEAPLYLEDKIDLGSTKLIIGS